MAQVTVELGRLLATDFKLFDFPYTIDDANFKAQLEQSIIDFYYDYEIGYETPDMFKRKFKARFLRNIDYYNKLYNTTLLSYNPLSNSVMTEALNQLSTNTNTATNNSKTTSNSQSTDNSNTTGSDYPQQPIAGGDYLSDASSSTLESSSDGTAETNASATNNGSSNMNYTKTIEGITGITYPELIQKHRDALLQVNNMVIEYMKPCFILVF